MNTEIRQRHHHHFHRDPEACDEPILLAEALKQETRAIMNVDIDKDYASWMLSLPKPCEVFFIRPEDMADPAALHNDLMSAEIGSILQIFWLKLKPLLPLSVTDAEMAKFLADGFNVLLRQEQLLVASEKLSALNIPSDLQRTICDSEAAKKWVTANRLILPFLLPTHIPKLSDTLPGVRAWLHAHPRTAVCFSGGGIRSATFGLGVMQGLARHGLLSEFDYLSTVSGGGYVGSWLSAWIAREKSAADVFAALKNDKINISSNPENEQIRHLREFSNYLTPRLGFLSADTWTMIGTYLRNLLLNWIIFIPALATLLMLPRDCLAVLKHKTGSHSIECLGGLAFFSGISAIMYAALCRPSTWKASESDGPIKSRRGSQAFFLWFCFVPLWICSICSIMVWSWIQHSKQEHEILKMLWADNQNQVPWWVFVASGAICHLLAVLLYVRKLAKGTKGWEVFSAIVSGAFGGALLWFGTSSLLDIDLTMAPTLEWYVCLASPCFLLAFLLAATLFIGLTSKYNSDDDLEWWARMGAWILIGILGWSVFSIITLFGPEFLGNVPKFFVSIGGLSTFVTLFLGYNHSTPANKKQEQAEGSSSVVSRLALAVAAPLFIVCLIALISLGTSWLLKAVVEPAFTSESAAYLQKANPGSISGRLVKTFGREPAFSCAAKFTADDIKNLPFFAALLTQHTNEVSTIVWTNLSPATQQQLQDTNLVNARNSPLRATLATNLNVLIATNVLYASTRFPTLELSPRILSHATSATNSWPQKQQQMQFNHWLLQQAFPEALDDSQFDHLMVTDQSPPFTVLVVTVVFGLITVFFSWRINVNHFSLHAVYRNRIIRAYLGASNQKRRPNPFSGFDPKDNLAMAELKQRPFHVINMALNLVTGENLAWQQRKAESFTATPLHAGNNRLGYRKVSSYASKRTGAENFFGCDERQGTDTRIINLSKNEDKGKSGLTVGTAVAISGAAASPNSGYHSSPIVAMLMTFFNVRLGAWLGNPGAAGDKSYVDRSPRNPAWHVLMEALGQTNDTKKYVYLSDGGHFENLGLYEMVLRRVHFIVVSDAGCDPDCALEDLGNAIRKIRIDLGIPIEIDQFNIGSRTNKPESKYCAIGHIDYSRVDGPDAEPGVLIYIKPAIAGNEPRDVFNYAVSSLLFPHEPTSDQWFSESQFESYRMLGEHIIDTMCDGANIKWDNCSESDLLQRFKNQAGDYLDGFKPLSAKDPIEKTISPGLK